MGTEIERKFLVVDESWRAGVRESLRMIQGYIPSSEATVRVRLEGERAVFTVKGRSTGISRSEWEWPIPTADAEAMLDELCEGRRVEKTRHFVTVGGHEWVVDEFAGDNRGLVMAEIELGSEDEDFARPDWAGEEVSHDRRYYNSSLARDPFATWGSR